MEEEDNIIVKWAQEDVETLYSVLNNNNIGYMFRLVNRSSSGHQSNKFKVLLRYLGLI